MRSLRPTTVRPNPIRIAACIAGIATLGLAASAGVGTYTVRPGDTLSGIANRHGVSVSELAGANGISNPDRIFAGTRLTIPNAGAGTPSGGQGGGSVYVVRPGDTLSGIASQHGVSLRALADANEIVDIHLIRIGSQLVIPAPDLAVGGVVRTGGIDTSRFPERLRGSQARLALVPLFEKWSAAYGTPTDLLMALAWLESGWQNHVVSAAGAVGIGQLMPATSDFVSDILLRTPLDPRVEEHNIRMSARFLRWLLDRTGGDETVALAAYYQGLASVRARGVLPSSETYARGVLAIRARHFAQR